MIGLRIEMEGQDRALRILEKHRVRWENLKPAFEKVADDFRRFEVEVFESEGAVQPSGRWARLSPKYARWKAANFPGRKILERGSKRSKKGKGEDRGPLLKPSLTKAGAPESVYEVTNTSLRIGTSVAYARWHQYGTGRMPKRRVIHLPKSVIDRWADMLTDYAMAEEG